MFWLWEQKYNMAVIVTIVNIGTGYITGDILTLTGGGNNCTVQVTSTIPPPDGVGGISLLTDGTGYADGTYATSPGVGGGDCTIAYSDSGSNTTNFFQFM